MKIIRKDFMYKESIKEEKQESVVKSNGVYSILNDEWIKEPEKDIIPDVEINQEEFNKLFTEWENTYFELLKYIEEDNETKLEEDSTNVYGLFAYKIDPKTGRVIDTCDEMNPVEIGTREYLSQQKKNYLDSWNANKQGDVFKFVIKFAGVQDFREECNLEESEELNELYPHKGETQDEFIKRFMHDDEMKKEYPTSKQRYAVAMSYWNRKDNLKEVVHNDTSIKSEDIEKFINDLYDLRKTSIKQDGEYGLGNLVFKEFRSKGYLDNLKKLKQELVSKELSL